MRASVPYLAAGACAALLLLASAPRLRTALATEAPPASTAAATSSHLRYPDNAPQLAMLQIEAVRDSPLPASEPLSARLAYDEDRTARIFPAVAGRIISTRAEPGESVRAGQALAEIDSPDYAGAASDLAKALADEARKLRTRDRARDLASDESVAAKDLEAAEADLAAAHAETLRARQRVHNLQPLALPGGGGRLVLASPLAGSITERNASPALEVAPGQALPLFVVSDLSQLWAFIDVPDRYLSAIAPGQRVLLETDDAPQRRHEARVARIARVIDPNTRRLSVRAVVQNNDGTLLPEMFVRARLLPDHGNAIQVPVAALVTRGVTTFVYVERQAHEFERRAVNVVRRDGDQAYVDHGLADGERVVTTGALLLDAEYPEAAGAAS